MGDGMKTLRMAALVMALAMGAQSRLAAAEALPSPPVCGRACLEGFIDQYLQALVAHDPARLPLARDVKFTENGSNLKLGDGLWGTVEAQGDYKLTFVDPDTAEAGAFVTVRESGRQALLALRLHIQSATRISQVETLVARVTPGQGIGGGHAPVMTKKPVFYEDVAPEDRADRAHMQAIADSYFEGLEHATDKLTPFAPDCQRIENGAITSGDPNAQAAMQKMTCGAQFATGFSPFITAVRERRYPIMDQQKGLAAALVFFDHAGKIKDVKMTDGSTLHVPPPFDAPYAFEIFELFKIDKGRIVRVEAVLNTVPYGMASGW
jgi:hypothetical protein